MDIHKNKREWWEYVVLAVAVLLIIIGLSSCKQIQYVPIEKIVTKDSIITKTEYVNKETKVKEYVAGDTVYHDSIVFCTILRCDTLYVHTNDTTTVVKEVEVVKEVDRKLNLYEKTMIRLGWCLIALIVAIIGWRGAKLYFKVK